MTILTLYYLGYHVPTHLSVRSCASISITSQLVNYHPVDSQSRHPCHVPAETMIVQIPDKTNFRNGG